MHMSDALLSPSVATVMYACSAIAAVYSYKKINLKDNQDKIPLLAILGALVFATQMINFTIPGIGSSGHLCGGLLLAALLGPYAAFIVMIAVLFIQSFIFADGGVLALGANIFNMGFYGCLVGGAIFTFLSKKGFSKGRIFTACILGSVISLQLGAFSVTVQTLASGVTDLPFMLFLSFMQPIHLAIGIGEGLITASIVCFVYGTRPELIYKNENANSENSLSYKSVLMILSFLALVIACVLSLYASAYPDGLEWSIAEVIGDKELLSNSGVAASAQSLQDSTAILPDYSFVDSSSAMGTSVSGLFGGVLVFSLSFALAYIAKLLKNVKA